MWSKCPCVSTMAAGRESRPKRSSAAEAISPVVPVTPASISTHCRSGAPAAPQKTTFTSTHRRYARSGPTSHVPSSLSWPTSAFRSMGICSPAMLGSFLPIVPETRKLHGPRRQVQTLCRLSSVSANISTLVLLPLETNRVSVILAAMKVLLIGNGGREHALAWKIADSARVTRLYALPGNPGIAQLAEIIPGSVMEFDKIKKFVRQEKIDLVVIGPEDPLASGLADVLTSAGTK